MLSQKENVPANKLIISLFVLINVIITELAFIHNTKWLWALLLTIPLLFIAIYNARLNE
jgi:hypothetical protein